MAGQQDGRRLGRPGRGLLAALAVVIVAIPVVIGIVISAREPGPGATPAVTTTAGFTPVGSTQPRRPPKSAGPRLAALPPGSGAVVAIVLHPTALRTSPAGRLARLSRRTQFGSLETVLVVRRAPGWLGVVAAEAGNDRIGWVAQRAVSLGRVPWELKVALRARRLTVLESGRVIQSFTVAVGQPDAPTPTGRFAVTDRLLTGNDAGPYGCCILALSAHSPHAIQGWTGGTRIAIHSTPDAASIGQAASHGCVRVTLAEGRWLLAHIPLGTPTLISS
jgi:L,D-transpeptidase catalytic domain